MPNSRPLAPDLLAIVQDYLATDISPQVSKVHQFQLKIVARVLLTVQRELELGPQVNAEEAQRLRVLLGREGSLDELNTVLAQGIRAGDFAIDDPALLSHLRQATEDALRINNPKWLTSPT